MYVCPLELKTLACLDFILYEISAFYSWKSFVTIFSKSFFLWVYNQWWRKIFRYQDRCCNVIRLCIEYEQLLRATLFSGSICYYAAFFCTTAV